MKETVPTYDKLCIGTSEQRAGGMKVALLEISFYKDLMEAQERDWILGGTIQQENMVAYFKGYIKYMEMKMVSQGCFWVEDNAEGRLVFETG